MPYITCSAEEARLYAKEILEKATRLQSRQLYVDAKDDRLAAHLSPVLVAGATEIFHQTYLDRTKKTSQQALEHEYRRDQIEELAKARWGVAHLHLDGEKPEPKITKGQARDVMRDMVKHNRHGQILLKDAVDILRTTPKKTVGKLGTLVQGHETDSQQDKHSNIVLNLDDAALSAIAGVAYRDIHREVNVRHGI